MQWNTGLTNTSRLHADSFVHVFLVACSVWTLQRHEFLLHAFAMWSCLRNMNSFYSLSDFQLIFHQFPLYSSKRACSPVSFSFQLFPASFTSFQLKTTPSSPLHIFTPLSSPSSLPSLTLRSIAAVMYRLLGLHFFSSYSTSPQRVSNTNVRDSVGASVGGDRAEDGL